jgi:hypothetical protein
MIIGEGLGGDLRGIAALTRGDNRKTATLSTVLALPNGAVYS